MLSEGKKQTSGMKWVKLTFYYSMNVLKSRGSYDTKYTPIKHNIS